MTGKRLWAAAALLFLVGVNLRLAIAAVPPVLGDIERDTGLSPTESGLLTGLPVLLFGAVALATPVLLKRFGLSSAMSFVLVVIIGGCLIRLAPSLFALFAGTAVLSSGIAIGNVLIPSLIKDGFAERQAPMMIGLVSVSISLGAAIPAGLTAPIADQLGLGWRNAIAVWSVGAMVTLALWLLRTRKVAPAVSSDEVPTVGRELWRDPVAWAVTLFMGLQSLAFYATLSWLPIFFEDHGMTQAHAGWMLSFSMFPGMLGAIVTPILGRSIKRPAALVPLTALLLGSAYVGLIVAPTSVTYLWMTLLGLGQGASLALSFGYMVARAPDSHHVAHLSTMSQGAGYLIAAMGPFLLGALHGLTSGWTVPLLVLIVNLIPLTVFGLLASRDRHVLSPPWTPS